MRHIACAFLLVSAAALAAHASTLEHPQETVLDNLDKIVTAVRPSTVVRNWSLVCTYHCRAAPLGVPCSCACDTFAENIPRRYQNKTYRNNRLIINSNLLSICGKTACSKKFVAAKLDALTTTTTAAEIMAIISEMYGNNVCGSFHDTRHDMPLDSCGECFKKFVANKHYHEQANVYEEAVEPAGDDTEPDWNDLCASLCKTGDGGSLCNCNLSPFNM